MKYRLDFVTNSSSSSFIFGKPNGDTVTISSVKNYIRNSAQRLLYIIKHLDREAYKISGVEGLLRKLRKSDDVSYKIESKVFDALYNSRIFKYKVKSIFKRFGIEITDDGSVRDKASEGNYIHYFCFLCSYLEYREFRWLKRIERGLELPVDFVDFRTNNHKYKYELDGVIGFYLDRNDYYNCGVNYNELAYKCLGEVALLGDDPCMPNLLRDYLYCKLDYACMHMG